MLSEHAASLRTILTQDLRSRLEQRDEFFETIMGGLKKNRKQLTGWVEKEVFLNNKVDKPEIEEVVDQIELNVLEHLLNQLDGNTQHQAYNLKATETLGQYCIRVARRDNIPRNGRHAITMNEVPKTKEPKTTHSHAEQATQQAQKWRANGDTPQEIVAKLNREGYTTREGTPFTHEQVSCMLDDMLIFAHRLDTSGYDANGNPVELPEYMTQGISAAVSIEEIDARQAFLRLDDVLKLVYILSEGMPKPPTRRAFEELAIAAAVASDRVTESVNRMEMVLSLRTSTPQAALRQVEIAQILGIGEKKLRQYLEDVEFVLV